MNLNGSYTYDAPVDALICMLRDPKTTCALYESMNHREVEVLECEQRGDVLRIRSSQVVDVNLPGFARRVLRPTNTMLQTDVWRERANGSWEGTFDVEVKGAPVHISGSMSLLPNGTRCTHEVAIAVSVKVPIIGGRIADWVGKSEVQGTLDKQFAFYARQLADRGQT